MRINDFVIAKKDIGNIVKNSVGIVASVSDDTADVYFIGKDSYVNILIDNIDYLNVDETGKGHKYKICNRCYVLKQELVDFEINQTDAFGNKTTRPSCNDCREIINGANMSASEKRRMQAIKPHGLYECPICHKKSIAFVTGKFVIDHNHKTGKARAWICDSCNTGLGRFNDDMSVMKGAIEYLKKYNDQD